MDSKKLIKIIRKLIKEEVQKAVKPIVNEILAEQFLKTVTKQKENPYSLDSVIDSNPRKPVSSNINSEANLEEKRNELRQKLLKRIGVSDNPMMNMIYEDVAPLPSEGAGIHPDLDDEGVDLSQFGIFRKQ